jgi:cell wall-associated NlpC family hydrolase
LGAYFIGGFNVTSQEIQQYVWNYLINKGLNEKATAGIMGNISQESSWDVTEIESGSGVGFGLCQWSYSRRTQLEAYGTDLDHQLNFLWSEMTGENLSETGAELQWNNAQGYTYSDFSGGNYSPSDSAAAFCWCWERPNASEANLSYRQSQAESFYTTYHGTSDDSAKKVENAVEWLINIANDNTHGYDQTNRWSPDYDCSSFVISGFEQAGIPLKTNGATYTGDLKNVAIATGFKVVDWGNDESKLIRGDILLNEADHVCVYIGNGQIVQASENELGTATGGQTGDQTGTEIEVRSYYVFSAGWDCVLRYGNGAITPPSNPEVIWNKILKTPFNTKQLSAAQISFIKTLDINSNVKMKFTFNHNKRQIGKNSLGNKLTFDNKTYKIKDVSTNGYIILTYGGSLCLKYVNPKYIQ